MSSLAASNAESSATLSGPRLEVQVDERPADGDFRVALTGELRHATATHFCRQLDRLLKKGAVRSLELDCRQLVGLDSAGAAALYLYASSVQDKNGRFTVTHLADEHAKILAILPARSQASETEHQDEHPLESLGDLVFEGWASIHAFYGVFTDSMVAVARAFRGRFAPPGSFTEQAVRIGVDAVPIVSLLSFLLGLVLAFQSAEQLRAFGASIYTADLVGIGMFREFGPLLTGIVLAGRSGSAMAAELGTMRVNEEVDALHTMGIDHSRFLVLPRLLGIVVVQPALTLVANLIGSFGGLLIGVFYLKITASGYLNQSLEAIQVTDFLQGIGKSAIFAMLIGLIACYSGLSVKGGATGVGRATTQAVVASIFMIIVADSIFTTISTITK